MKNQAESPIGRLRKMIREEIKNVNEYQNAQPAWVTITRYDANDKSNIVKILKQAYGTVYKTPEGYIKVEVDPAEIDDAIDYIEHKLSLYPDIEVYEY